MKATKHTKRMDRAVVAKRRQMREDFFARMFLLGGMPADKDTYKDTMGQADDEFACAPAAYHLTLRKGLNEPGATHLVTAGHEAMLAQWFHRPLKRADILLWEHFALTQSAVKAFPSAMWRSILNSPINKGKQNIYLPMDVWGFPGGMCYPAPIKTEANPTPISVPMMTFEGVGGIITNVESAMCRYFAPVIQATKAHLMGQVTPRDAEFGLRAAPLALNNIILLLARYVGSGGTGTLTSNDAAEFMWPELFKRIGTIGHEMMCSNQDFERMLAECEQEMMERYVERMGSGSLLCDLVDAETVGLENAIAVMKRHPEKKRVGIRVDSGDIDKQCVDYFVMMVKEGICGEVVNEEGGYRICSDARTIVFEDEVNPVTVERVYTYFREKTGYEPTMLFPGAGGYWWKNVHRDVVSAAFKRSMTSGRPNVKFSNSPGKESLGGNLRVWGRGDTMIVADVTETIPGAEMLFVKLVEQGRIVYNESFQAQAARKVETWGKYTNVELSPKVADWMKRFGEKRASEVAAARARMGLTTKGA